VNGLSWTLAEANSVALGGHLAAISSKSENDYLFSTFGPTPNPSLELWIGLNDAQTEGVWQWSNGEAVTYTNWAPGVAPSNTSGIVYGPNLGSETQDYVNFWWGSNNGTWDDYYDNDNTYTRNGIAEIPLTLSITRQGEVKEGSGVFTTSINLSAGTQVSGNLTDGAQVWWNITGITADDLVSGALSGNGIITNGKLDLQHSLKVDPDSGESFEVSVFSDALMTQQVGATSSVTVQESSPVIRGKSLYRIVDGPSWTQAESNSVTVGGHLVAINNSEENVFIADKILQGRSEFALWTGLTDSATEGTFYFSDGATPTYFNWVPTEPFDNGGEDYTLIYTGNTIDTTIDYHRGKWNDVRVDYDRVILGIAEIPLSLSITRTGELKEGSGVFTTSINLSAGTQLSGNLAEGAQVWWKITGITADDLVLGALSGTGTILNGKLDLQHSLAVDADTGEQFQVSVFSDALMTQQIGAMSSVAIAENRVIRGNSIYRIVDGPNWTQAETNAVAMGGHLVTIESAGENSFLTNSFAGISTGSIDGLALYIGYTDRVSERIWQWVSGSTSTYQNWAVGEPNSGGNPTSGMGEDYAVIYPTANKYGVPGVWNDLDEIPSLVSQGIAEIPLTLSITRQGEVKEGSGLFSTSINISAGTQASGNLTEGAQVWWKVTGITADDLVSGALSGTGTIQNGKLDIQHSLAVDADTGEQFEVSVFSDASMTSELQIGITQSTIAREVTITTMAEAITGISMSNNDIDLTNTEGATVVATFTVAPSITGITRIQAQWSASNGNARIFSTLIQSGVDNQGNLIFTGQLHFGKYYSAGTWSLSAISIIDDTNSRTILSSGGFVGLPNPALPSGVLVTNANGDSSIPVLQSVGFDKANVSIEANGNIRIPIIWSYADSGSAVVNREVQIYDPQGRYYGTVNDALYLPSSAEKGVWTINNARLDDRAANIFFTADLQSSSGSLSFLLSSDPLSNNLIITAPGAGTIDGIPFTSTYSIDLGLGPDTATLTSAAGLNTQMTVEGGAGIDTLNGNENNNVLVLTGENQGNLDGLAFSGFENVALKAGDDIVYILPGGSLTGLLSGGGTKKLVYLPPGAPVPPPGGVITPPVTPPTTPPITITPLPPGSDIDGWYNYIYLNDNTNIITLTGAGSGVVDGTNFTNFYAVDLRGGADIATINTGGSLLGTLAGGDGTDTLNLSSGANSLSIDQTLSGTAAGTSISGFESINLLDGNDTAVFSINSSAIVPASRQSLTLDGGTGTDALTLKLTKAELDFLSSAETLSALTTYLSNPTNQSITLALSILDLTLTGFESTNLFLPDGDLPDLNPATLSLQFLDTAFSAALPTASTGSIAINNSADFNGTIPITYGPASTNGLYGTLAVSSAGLSTYTGNGTAIKNQSTSTLTDTFQVSATDGNTTKTADYNVSIANPTAENTLLISATSSGSIDGISFGSTAASGAYAGTLLSSIDLGAAADTATLTDGAGTTAALTLNGGAGFDRLNGNASANNLIITGLDQGTLDLVSFSSIENIYLEGGNDTVTIQAGGRLSGILDGGAGSNTLTVDGSYTISIGDGGTIVIDNGNGGGGSFSGFQNIGGGGTPQSNSLTLNTNSNVVAITGPNSGTADGTAFTNISDINLAAGDDYAILAAVGSLTGTLSGGTGTDDLTLSSAINSVVLSQSGAGTAASTGNAVSTAFNGFEVIRLDAGNDTADLDLNGTTALTLKRQLRLDGGQGSDQLTLRFNAQERQNLISTGQLAALQSFISNPTEQTLTVSLLEVDLVLAGFETAVLITPNQAPTDLTFTSSGIAENSPAGTLIGALSANDAVANSSFTYQLVAGDGTNDADNALVEIVGSEVKVKSGAAIDFETNPVLNLNIQVTDNGTPGLNFTKAVTAAVLNVNEAPTDLTFTSSGIAENSSAGAVIGTLAATDPDSGSSFTYAILAGNGTNDADNALVEIVGSEVKVKSGAVIDFETNPVLNLNIQVTDNGTPGLTYTKAVSAAVLNVNEVPTDLVFTSSGINENSAASTVIGTLSATDPDSGSSFTYALATGNGTNDADNALVDIVGNEVRVKSGASIDF
jgi:hypothetical protein